MKVLIQISVQLILTYLVFLSSLSFAEASKGLFLTPDEIVRLEMEQFENEVEEFRKVEAAGLGPHVRNKRTVTFNSNAPLDLGVLIGIPLSIALPTFQNFWNWNWKFWKRSVDSEDETEFEDSAIAQPHLDKIAAYFELIQIPERGCQERAICEFSAEPDKFFPVSELILHRIRHPSTLPLMGWSPEAGDTPHSTNGSDAIQPNSLLKLYNSAADRGMANGLKACSTKFAKKCPYSTEKRLNMPVLKFWNLLSSLLKFSFKDNLVMKTAQ